MELDGQILVFIQENIRNLILNPAVTVVTSLGNGAAVWVLISLIMLFFKRTRKAGIMSILALLVSLLVNNVVLKNLVARTRPYEVVEGLMPLIKKPWDYSFPSGHAASSFASAWVFFKNFPKRFGVPAFVLAGLIGLSRLYVGVHYPTDVLFGVASGILCGVIAIFLVQKICSILPDRFTFG